MRLHRNLVLASVEALEAIFNQGKQADKVLHRTLKQDKRWGARDRAFIAETTYDIVRWKRLYQEIAGLKEPFTERSLFKLFAVWATQREIRLPDWKEFEGIPIKPIKQGLKNPPQKRAIKASIPDWMDELGYAELGKQWETELRALNEQAQVILRVNPEKIDRTALIAQLKKEGIETSPLEGLPLAIVLAERKNVFATEAFKSGLFEVQDGASQMVAPMLQAAPGQCVIDACAGAGGKALHLAALMENKGQLIALDIYPQKLQELKRRARRNGLHNIETRLIDSTRVIKKLKGRADSLLIDAPCTGLGVLRRNPDSKWKLQPEFVDNIRATQQELLQSYGKMVKEGGALVYATCSILPSENELQVKTFLESEAGAGFTLAEQKNILPSETGLDGFYMARMTKTATGK